MRRGPTTTERDGPTKLVWRDLAYITLALEAIQCDETQLWDETKLVGDTDLVDETQRKDETHLERQTYVTGP
jgi:hypothetical protein